MKETCIIYKSWAETITELEGELKEEVVDALLKYALLDQDIDDISKNAKAIIKPWIAEINKNNEKYEQKRENLEKNKKAHKENKQKSNRNQAENKQKTGRNQSEIDSVSESVSVSVNVSESVNDSVNDLKETPTESVSKKKTSKKESPVYFPQDELLEKTFQDYILTRKQIKAPMTDRAIELAINKLNDLSNGDNNRAVKILERSIMNGWKGLFPLDDPPNKSSGFKKAEDELHDFYAMTKDWAERSTYESTGI